MPDPETIDINLEMIGGDALKALQKNITDTQSLLGDIRSQFTGTGALPIQSTPGGGGGRSTGVAAPTYQGHGGSQAEFAPPPGSISGSQPWAPVIPPAWAAQASNIQPQKIPSAADPTVQDVFAQANFGGSPGAANDPGRLAQAAQWAKQRAMGLPVIGSLARNMADDEGMFTAQGIGTGVAFTAGNWLTSQLGQAANSALPTVAMQAANPWSAMAAGQAQGLPGGSMQHIGPFGFQSPFGPAQQASWNTFTQALPAVLQGGQTFAGSMQIEEALQATGIKPTGGTNAAGQSDFQILSDMMNHVLQSDQGGELKGLDRGVAMSMVHDMIQYGATSQNQVQDAFRNLGEVATGTGMSLNDFAEGLRATTPILQGMGLTYYEAHTAAKNFSAATNMPPEVMGELAQNPLVQARIMAQTGLPPAAQGLFAKDTGAFTKASTDTVRQMVRMMSNVTQGTDVQVAPGVTRHISSQREAMAIAAKQLNMPIDQISNLLKYGGQSEALGGAGDAARMYQSELKRIGQQYGRGTPEYRRALNQLQQGTGQFGGGAASWQDVQRSLMKGGMSADRLAHLDAMSPRKRAQAVNDYIAKTSHKRVNPQANKPEVKIGFTGLAEKFFKTMQPGLEQAQQNRKAVNKGDTSSDKSWSKWNLGDVPTDVSKLVTGAANEFGPGKSLIDIVPDISPPDLNPGGWF